MRISGCVPVTVCPAVLHRGNAVVVGDAARQDNPLTAGGIMNTLEAADLLVRSLTAPGLSPARALARYSATWRRRARFEQKVFLLLQRVFLDCSDREISRLLVRADRAFGHLTDRSRTFRWPLADLVRLFCMVAPKAMRHASLLWR
jgi:flavin-dependent dehydrogenase